MNVARGEGEGPTGTDLAATVAAHLARAGAAPATLSELRAWRDRLHAVLQFVADAIVVVDFTGAVVYVNEPVLQMLGLERASDVLGRRLSALYARRTVLDEHGEVVALGRLPGVEPHRGDGPVEVLLRFRDASSGAEAVARVRTAPICDDQRRVVALVQSFHDVTTEHRVRKRLELLASASGALAASPDATQALDEIVRLAASQLASTCVLDVVEGDALRRVAFAFGASEPAISVDLRGRRPLPPPDARGLGAALATGAAEHVAPVDAAVLEAVLGREHAPAFAAAARSLLSIPIASRGHVTAALTLVSTAARFEDEDAALAAGLARTAGAALENTRLFEAERSARARVSRLQEVTAALSRARSTGEVAEVSCRIAAEAMAASSGALWLVQPDGWLALEGAWGTEGSFIGQYQRLSPTSGAPAVEVVRTGVAQWFETEDDYRRKAPAIHAQAKAAGRLAAFAVLPITVEDRPAGVIVFAHSVPHAYDADERAFYVAVAQHCSQAIERARLLDTERRNAERLALLARAGDILSASLHDDDALPRLAAALVPALGDACVIELRDDGGALRAFAAGDEKSVASGAVEGRLTVPLRAGGEVLGALTLVHGERSGRRHGREDVAFARELAARVALSLDQRRLYRAARDAAARADEANRIKDEFLATVSHELRTPLTAIAGWSTLLADRVDDRDAVARGLAVIHRNARAQSKIIEDILDVSRIVSGKLLIEREPVDLVAIAEEALEVLGPAARAGRVSMAITSDAASHVLAGDAERLRQVVWNLLANAIKYTGEGGAVTVRVERDGARLRLIVADTGDGIAPSFLPYVFDRFRQADSSTTRKHGGLGLGLAIVRRIVELHEGRVTADSAGLRRGSTFCVELPVRDVVEPSPAAPRSARAPRASLEGVRALVVDDEPDARELVQMVLEGAGAEVRAAPSARAAIDALSAFPADVVVSDIGMPDRDGYWLVEQLRARGDRGALAAVALSAYARPEDRARALAAGFDNHVAKPVDPKELVTVVAELAARR